MYQLCSTMNVGFSRKMFVGVLSKLIFFGFRTFSIVFLRHKNS